MAQHNDELREIMAQSRVERQALFQPVGEISRRLHPRYMVDAATEYAKRKVSGAVAGVSETIKENGGTAAAVAVGVVAVFESGRRSAGGGGSARAQSGSGSASEVLLRGLDAGGVTTATARPVSNLARTKALGGALGGVLLGHVIGRAFQPTAKERDLFGNTSSEVQAVASKFVSQHAQGAKLAAAQAFGFARYSAAFLAIMAALSEYFVSAADGREPPTNP
ncbi:hypothetical protein DBIPINDM_008322 (plasmid) [Mesorhizobium sp. AR02]|uniref:hypothetical protein n=1 Tax=Mesorhizobium sp. AR02 TaxID=2865837 RepID=UPI00215FB30A|nr:hypothetical protein [Mesorhizobium sp. AR02]UVK57379.1 hypothetical protein DBIPINDM_008322 [Mesorhizobium sp. AR02]